MKIHRKRGTFAIQIGEKLKMPFIQFTLKQPWLLPRHESDNQKSMCGWLFVYFGYIKLEGTKNDRG